MVRRFQISFIALMLAAVFCTLAMARKGPADDKSDAAAVERGRTVFNDKCDVCHYSDSEDQKMGPGLKGIYKKGKYSDGSPVTDESMKKWITDGGKSMPPFKDDLDAKQIDDLIAYIKTL